MSKSRKQPSQEQTDFDRFQTDHWSLPQCFIIHAWSPPHIFHVIRHIKNALKDNFFVTVDDDFPANHGIRLEALAAIRQSALVICILDDLAPNVVYEYGYAAALDKPCIPMVCKGAVVDVKRFFAEGKCPDGLENPSLDIDKHFGDVKDLLHCEYDDKEPDAPRDLLAKELKKPPAGSSKPLSRQVLDTWVSIWREELGEWQGSFEPLFDYILKSTIKLDKHLFATRRKTTFNKHLTHAIQNAQKATPAPSKGKAGQLPDVVVEALTTLLPKQRLEAVRKLLETYPSDRRLLFSECLAADLVAEEQKYRSTADNAEAIHLHDAFLARFPDSVAVHCNYATLLKSLGRRDEAEEHYCKALDIDPDRAAAHYNYANLLDDLGRKVEAEKHYRTALEIDPDYSGALNNYAYLLMGMDRMEEAEKNLRKALKIDPELAEAWMTFGELYQQTDVPSEARRCFGRALELGTLSAKHTKEARKYLADLPEEGDS